MLRWQRVAIVVSLVLAWLTFAAWQYREYVHECGLIRETLHQQTHSVMNALIGGIKSHRRLGRFFRAQVESLVTELATAEDVLAASVVSADLEMSFEAGDLTLLPATTTRKPGGSFEPQGFCLIEQFELEATPDMPDHEIGGFGMGRGGGGRRRLPEEASTDGATGGFFTAVLVLDRERADVLCRSAATSHLVAALAGALVVFCLALAWWASVRLVATQGHAQLLETEARHLRELSQAAAGLAHETRNPLGLVRGWTQRLAQDVEDEPERHRQAQAVIEECDRIAARINQFLAYARPCEPEFATTNVHEVTQQLAVILQPDLEAKNIQLRDTGVQSGCTVRADRELLRQALFNLVQNAIQWSPEGTDVDITAERSQNGTRRIIVADQGPGVAKDGVDSLFTPYFTTRPDGTGLGLAIVRRIATAHGWQVSYLPRPEGGAVFSLDGIHG